MKKETTTGIIKSVKKLSNNALFKLSLGSKELFHSNFLESILSIESPEGRNFSKNFFEIFLNCNLDETIFLDTSREQNHLDLRFNLYKKRKKRPTDKIFTILIENKVKSIPNKEQLDKYYEDYQSLAKEKDQFVLLSLMKPEDFEEKDVKQWTIKTYKDLSRALRLALKKTENTLPTLKGKITFKNLIEEYIDFVTALSNLEEHIDTKKEDSYDFFDGDISGNNFRKLRIHDLVLKLKFQQIKALIKKDLEASQLAGYKIAGQLTKKIQPEPYTIYLNTDFTNSKALVDATVCLGKIMQNGRDINLKHCLSVQLQGDQLRYCSYLHNTIIKKEDKLSTKDIKAIHSKLIPALKEKWFDNKELKSLFLQKGLEDEKKGFGRKNAETGEKPGYCKFDDEFYFRYDIITKSEENRKQKVPIKGSDQTTIAEILDCFKILMTYIINNKSAIIEELTLVNDSYSYLKGE
jgi:hypothetical protein